MGDLELRAELRKVLDSVYRKPKSEVLDDLVEYVKRNLETSDAK